MKIINKTGIKSIKKALEVKFEYGIEGTVFSSAAVGEKIEMKVDYGEKLGSWFRTTVEIHRTKAGNLIVERT